MSALVHDNATVLIDRIRDEISVTGPMRFDRFMEIALYDPAGGYFSSDTLRSDRAGDFLTSPEVSSLFGETLARFCAAERERIGEPFNVVECGAGSGSLLAPLVGALQPDAAWAVEVSPGAQAALREHVPSATVVGSLDEVASPVRGVIVANELLDNLPAAVAVRRGDGWVERAVVVDGDGIGYDEVAARDGVAEWADRFAGEVPGGGVVEVQLAAVVWLRAALASLEAGALLVVDYGDTAEGLASRRSEGTVRTYRGHHLGPDPLLEPGATDITMDVDFGALAAVAEEEGATVEVVAQAEFLTGWGLREVVAELREGELAAAKSGDVMEQMRLRSRRIEAETLLHPRGLGDFRVLAARV